MWLAGLLIFLGWMLSLCLHEFGHAVVAYFGGDTSVKEKGYLTLNPLNYTDPGLSLMMPMIFLLMGGIALPGGAVYIDHRRLRNRWWDSAVSVAGPFANMLVTFLLAIPFWCDLIPVSEKNWLGSSIAFLIFLEIFAVVLNLLPLPPLDGYGIIRPWLPPKIQHTFNRFGKYGIWIIVGLLWFVPLAGRVLWGVVYQIALILNIPLEAISEGTALLDKPAVKLTMILAFLGFLWLIKRHETQKQNAPEFVLFHQGKQLQTAKQYAEAIAIYDQVLTIKPNFSEVWYHRADSLYHLQRYDEAIAAYHHILQLQPEWATAWYNLACCQALQGQANLALEALAKAINLEPHFKEQAQTDPDFNSLQDQPGFHGLITQA